MMGVAENIADLRSLLSIVAEDTGALTLDDADEESVGWTTEGPLPMTFGHVRRAHAALAAVEATLSTRDAEPAKTAPAVAVKALEPEDPAVYRHWEKDELIAALIAERALSAQVQDEACSHLREILERWRDGCGFKEDSDEDVALLERASRVAKHGDAE